jgi:hypothetical protein
MPRKSKTNAKKTEPKQKQKQTQKQTVNVIINNEKKKATLKKKVLTSSQKINNVTKQLTGAPSKELIYRAAKFNRPVNYNIVPELPITNNQLMTEMRQIMNAHQQPAEKTPLQMTEDVARSLMNKANGIVKDIKQNQTEINAANKIKAHIKQKISSDALEQIIDENIDSRMAKSSIPSDTPIRSMRPRRTNVRIAIPPQRVTLAMFRDVMGNEAASPPLNQDGTLRRSSKLFKEYLQKSKAD